MNEPMPPTIPPSSSAASSAMGGGSSAIKVLVMLLMPAALCGALGVVGSSSGSEIYLILFGCISVIGSLIAGIASGMALARRMTRPGGNYPLVAGALSVGCIVVSGALCVGGCVGGVLLGGIR